MKICLLYKGNVSTQFQYIDRIRQALQADGHEVQDVLWDIYNTGPVAPLPTGIHAFYGKGIGVRSLVHTFSFLRFLRQTLKELRPDAVHAVNEEMSVFAILAKPSRATLISDLRDSVVDRLALRPGLLKKLVQAVHAFVLSRSKLILVADPRRQSLLEPQFQAKSIISENIPDDLGPSLKDTPVEGTTKVFVSGSLFERRGLRVLLEAAEGLPNLEIWAAGLLKDAYANEVFARSPMVRFYGLLTPDEALRTAARTDAIFAFYAPDCRNHIYASPSKLYDAMCIGRKLLINSETKLAPWAVEQGIALSAPYHDKPALREALLRLAALRATIPESAARTRDLYDREFSWVKIRERIQSSYRSLVK